jgi:hypothetical protein
MLAAAMMLLAAVSTVGKTTEAEESSVQSMLNEEPPDVFLAKATLQQYLSRVVRKDWDGARRLTHPKALSAIAALKKRAGAERHNLAPWANREAQLKTFRFGEAKELAPGVILVAVGEDVFNTQEQGMSADDPAVYLLFKSHGGFLVGDKKAGVEPAEVSADSVRAGYPGWVDPQAKAQARRAEAPRGKHR